MNNAHFVLAVPSKGRLQEKRGKAFFTRAGACVWQSPRRAARDYRGNHRRASTMSRSPYSLGERDRPGSLRAAMVHPFGVNRAKILVPRKLLPIARQARAADRTAFGFGGANVVVAVPQAWIDVRHHGRSRRRLTHPRLPRPSITRRMRVGDPSTSILTRNLLRLPTASGRTTTASSRAPGRRPKVRPAVRPRPR